MRARLTRMTGLFLDVRMNEDGEFVRDPPSHSSTCSKTELFIWRRCIHISSIFTGPDADWSPSNGALYGQVGCHKVVPLYKLRCCMLPSRRALRPICRTSAQLQIICDGRSGWDQGPSWNHSFGDGPIHAYTLFNRLIAELRHLRTTVAVLGQIWPPLAGLKADRLS